MTDTKRIDTGDHNEYKVLFDTFYPALTSFIFKYINEWQASEDIAQDLFFDFWARKLSFENEIAFKTYCYRAARSRCLDYLKHKKVHQKNAPYIASVAEVDDFLNHILEEEVFTLLKKAIDQLPEDTRRVYELTLLGHDNQEIAEITHTTLNSVKSRKKRGKQMLQERLKETFVLIFPLII